MSTVSRIRCRGNRTPCNSLFVLRENHKFPNEEENNRSTDVNGLRIAEELKRCWDRAAPGQGFKCIYSRTMRHNINNLICFLSLTWTNFKFVYIHINTIFKNKTFLLVVRHNKIVYAINTI